jgi:hypothetical protein
MAYFAVSIAGRLLGEVADHLGAPCVLPRPDAEARKRRLMTGLPPGDCQTRERLKIKELHLKHHW